MTRIIGCVSGKGGVGKTMLVANLGAALAELGKDVVVIDGNLTTPNLGIHLGLSLSPKTLHDVLKGRAKINDVIYEHESGLKIIPAGIALKDLKGADPRDLPNALLDLLGNTDIVMLDASAGLGREALSAIEAGDELVLVTNPELPALVDVLKAIRLAEEVGTKVSGVIINRVTRKRHELTKEEIQNILDDTKILAEIPEDIAVKEAIAKKMPAIHYKPLSPASVEIRRLAAKLVGEEANISEPWHRKLFGFLFRR